MIIKKKEERRNRHTGNERTFLSMIDKNLSHEHDLIIHQIKWQLSLYKLEDLLSPLVHYKMKASLPVGVKKVAKRDTKYVTSFHTYSSNNL